MDAARPDNPGRFPHRVTDMRALLGGAPTARSPAPAAPPAPAVLGATPQGADAGADATNAGADADADADADARLTRLLQGDAALQRAYDARLAAVVDATIQDATARARAILDACVAQAVEQAVEEVVRGTVYEAWMEERKRMRLYIGGCGSDVPPWFRF